MNRKNPPHPHTSQAGFTLAEILLVMLISISLSTGGLYGWQRWQAQQQLRQTVQQVRLFLQHLRDDANWHNRNHYLWVTYHQQGWCLGSDRTLADELHDGDTPPSHQCDRSAFWQLNAPFTGVSIAEITPYLTFYGLSNTAWAGHITLRNAAGEGKVIISNWGRIRVCYTEGKPAC